MWPSAAANCAGLLPFRSCSINSHVWRAVRWEQMEEGASVGMQLARRLQEAGPGTATNEDTALTLGKVACRVGALSPCWTTSTMATAVSNDVSFLWAPCCQVERPPNWQPDCEHHAMQMTKAHQGTRMVYRYWKRKDWLPSLTSQPRLDGTSHRGKGVPVEGAGFLGCWEGGGGQGGSCQHHGSSCSQAMLFPYIVCLMSLPDAPGWAAQILGSKNMDSGNRLLVPASSL